MRFGIETNLASAFPSLLKMKAGSRPNQAGTYSWSGAFSKSYWVDPKEEMIVLLCRQILGYYVRDTDRAFKPLVYQAIND